MPNQNNLWFGICIKLLVTSAYLNFITSKLLADLWHWEFITGFLWSTAALSDSPIIGKAIFLLKMKPNMLLIWWTLVQRPDSKCVYSKYMLWHFAYSYGVRNLMYTCRRWLFYSYYIQIFSFWMLCLCGIPNFLRTTNPVWGDRYVHITFNYWPIVTKIPLFVAHAWKTRGMNPQ